MEIFLLYNKPIFSSSSQEIEVIINLGAFLLTALPSLREVRCHFEATDQKIRKSPICVLQHGRRTLGMEKKVKEKKLNFFPKVFFYQTDFSSPQSTLQSLLYPEAYEGMADSNWGGGYGSPSKNKKTRTKRWLKKVDRFCTKTYNAPLSY